MKITEESPIQFVNCTGILGIMYGEPTFIEKNNILLSSKGLSYREKDRSGYVIDCREGFLIQAFFNSFFSIPSTNTEEAMRVLKRAISVGWGGGVFLSDRNFDVDGALRYFVPVSNFIPKNEIREVKIQEKFVKTLENKNSFRTFLFIESLHELDDETLDKIREFKEKNDAVILIKTQIEVGEVFKSIEKYRKTSIERLLEHDLLSESTVIVGGDWITGKDAEAIRSRSSWIVHLPTEISELALGSSFPIHRFAERRYTRILLGTGARYYDSPLFLASYARMFYRFSTWSRSLDASDILRMLWGGWKLISEKMACIEEGCSPLIYIFNIGKPSQQSIFEILTTEGYYFSPQMFCLPEGGCQKLRKD
ncbi:MAG: hypothetical protein ACP5I2_02505 [Fervidicoccaceae archaeon]